MRVCSFLFVCNIIARSVSYFQSFLLSNMPLFVGAEGIVRFAARHSGSVKRVVAILSISARRQGLDAHSNRYSIPLLCTVTPTVTPYRYSALLLQPLLHTVTLHCYSNRYSIPLLCTVTLDLFDVVQAMSS